jgi:hypothetical protein
MVINVHRAVYSSFLIVKNKNIVEDFFDVYRVIKGHSEGEPVKRVCKV